MVFRNDINLLRAIAVTLVVFYHFKIPGFQGGFVGVDVFFVISGFLMTQIILSQRDSASFSLTRFYLARAARIIPALSILIFVLAILGYFILIPKYYVSFANNALASLVFISNYHYAAAPTGYFDLESSENLLLHTWSLSVEWIFYLFYPIFLMCLGRNNSLIKKGLWILFGLSFAYSNHLLQFNPEGAFYYLSSRMWEMVLGGLIYVHKMAFFIRYSKLSTIFGAILLLLAVCFFDVDTPWPGYHALLPTLGTALIIASQPSYFGMKIPIIKHLGLYSYSIYLWHWPLLFFSVYFSIFFDFNGAQYAFILLSVIMGALSFHGIEKPILKWSKQNSPKSFLLVVFFMGLSLLCMLFYIQNQTGFPNRLPEKQVKQFSEVANKDPKIKECLFDSAKDAAFCQYGTGINLKAIVWGDSHAHMWVNAVGEIAENRNGHVLSWTAANCPTIVGVKSTSRQDIICHEQVSRFLTQVKSQPHNTPVIIGNRLNLYFAPNSSVYVTKKYSEKIASQFYQELGDGYKNAVCELSQTHPVYIMQPIPQMKRNVLDEELKYLLVPYEGDGIYLEQTSHIQSSQKAFEINSELVRDCGVKLLDPLPFLCQKGKCMGSKDGVPYYYDDDHLSLHGAKLLKPLLENVLLY